MTNRGLIVTACVVVAGLAVIGWLHDFITMGGGGRTVYGVECSGGNWKGNTCTGHMVAAERHRFKVLRNHAEVLYWVVGSSAPSGKLTDCVVETARDWTCKQAPAQPPTVTYGMKNGQPVAAQGKAPTQHSVAKWKWLLLRRGVNFSEADT
jgi:hypothetical protein